jgi:O-antigen ligase
MSRTFVAGEINATDSLSRVPPAFATAWLLAFSVPWDDMIVLPGQVQLARVVAIVVAAIWLGSILRGGSVRRPASSFAWMGAFLLWASASIFWSNDPEHTVRRAFSYLQLFVIAWVVYQFASSRTDHLRLLQAFVLGEYVLVVRVIMSFARGEMIDEGRYSAPGVNPNDLAGTLAIGVPIACYLIATGSKRYYWLNALYVPGAVVCVVLNASRSGLLSLGAALIFPLLMLSAFRFRTRLAVLGILALSVGAAITTTDDISWRRLATIGDQLSTRDLNGRFNVWDYAMVLFEEHPVTGIGAGTFVTTSGGAQALAIAGHNSFIEVMVENGAVGILLFLAILVALFADRYRAGPLESRLWMVLFVTWLLVNMANSWENKNITWLLWGLSLGYPLARRVPKMMWVPVMVEPVPARRATLLQGTRT